MDHIHLAIKVSKPKVNLAYRLLVAIPANVINQSKPIHDKDYTRDGVTRYGVVSCTFTRRFLPSYYHCARIIITER
jgi:hypothetical protein